MFSRPSQCSYVRQNTLLAQSVFKVSAFGFIACTNRPVAKNFQVGVLSPRVLGPGEREARRIDSRETGFLRRGFTPSHQLVGHGSAVCSSSAGSKNASGVPIRNRIFCILALKS